MMLTVQSLGFAPGNPEKEGFAPGLAPGQTLEKTKKPGIAPGQKPGGFRVC